MEEKVKKNYYVYYEADSVFGDPEELDEFDEIYHDYTNDYERIKKQVDREIRSLSRNCIFISETKEEHKTILIYGSKTKNVRYKLEYNLTKEENEDDEEC